MFLEIELLKDLPKFSPVDASVLGLIEENAFWMSGATLSVRALTLMYTEPTSAKMHLLYLSYANGASSKPPNGMLDSGSNSVAGTNGLVS